MFCLAGLVLSRPFSWREQASPPLPPCVCWHLWVVGFFISYVEYMKQKENPGNSQIHFLDTEVPSPSTFFPLPFSLTYVSLIYNVIMFRGFSSTYWKTQGKKCLFHLSRNGNILWTYGYLFYTLGSNPILFSFLLKVFQPYWEWLSFLQQNPPGLLHWPGKEGTSSHGGARPPFQCGRRGLASFKPSSI